MVPRLGSVVIEADGPGTFPLTRFTRSGISLPQHCGIGASGEDAVRTASSRIEDSFLRSVGFEDLHDVVEIFLFCNTEGGLAVIVLGVAIDISTSVQK